MLPGSLSLSAVPFDEPDLTPSNSSPTSQREALARHADVRTLAPGR